MLKACIRLTRLSGQKRIQLVISRANSTSSPESSPPPTSLVKSDTQSSVADSQSKNSINSRVIWRDNEAIKRTEAQFDITDPEPLIIPQPVKQEWISRIPVEYHGTLSENFNNDTEWLPVYRLPYITKFRAFIRAKVYLTGISIGICGQHLYNLLIGNSNVEFSAAVLLSGTTLVGLIFTGDYFRRVACQIYTTEDLNFVRISRFTFFGRRRDLVLPTECIVPLPELNPSYRAPVLKLRFQMPEKINIENDEYEFYESGLHLPIRLGGILDRARFRLVMGNVFNRIGE